MFRSTYSHTMEAASLDNRLVDRLELALTALTTGVGAWVAVSELTERGLIADTVFFLVGAAIGVLGLVLVADGQRRSRRAEVVAGLLLAVASPTVFAYPLNALLLVAAAAEVAVGLRRRLRVAA
jgi:hypothetical protein